jgi:hypothetical protein
MPHDPEMRKALLKLMEENLVAFPPGYTKEEFHRKNLGSHPGYLVPWP